MKKKVLLTVLTGLVCLATFAGCSGKDISKAKAIVSDNTEEYKSFVEMMSKEDTEIKRGIVHSALASVQVIDMVVDDLAWYNEQTGKTMNGSRNCSSSAQEVADALFGPKSKLKPKSVEPFTIDIFNAFKDEVTEKHIKDGHVDIKTISNCKDCNKIASMGYQFVEKLAKDLNDPLPTTNRYDLAIAGNGLFIGSPNIDRFVNEKTGRTALTPNAACNLIVSMGIDESDLDLFLDLMVYGEIDDNKYSPQDIIKAATLFQSLNDVVSDKSPGQPAPVDKQSEEPSEGDAGSYGTIGDIGMGTLPRKNNSNRFGDTTGDVVVVRVYSQNKKVMDICLNQSNLVTGVEFYDTFINEVPNIYKFDSYIPNDVTIDWIDAAGGFKHENVTPSNFKYLQGVLDMTRTALYGV